MRVGLYRPVVEALLPRMPVGLCEETPDVWRACGLDPERPYCNCIRSAPGAR